MDQNKNQPLDTQKMTGGSYLVQPDGTVAKVAGPDMTEVEKQAAPALRARHEEIQADAKARHEADLKAKVATIEAPASGVGTPVKAAAAADKSVQPAALGAAGKKGE
jgi:hypothetical protein